MTRAAMIDEAVTDAMRDQNLLRVWQRYKMVTPAIAGIVRMRFNAIVIRETAGEERR